VPRAIFVSIGFVTVLYVLVVVVVVLAINDAGFLSFLAERAGIRSPEAATAFLTDHGEAAMARAAQYYLGEAGFYVFVGGALLSMVSAANATVLAGSRVTLAMAERDQLPAAVGRVSPSTGAPTVAVGVTGGLILAFFLGFAVVFGHTPGEPGRALLGLESLAHFADAMLLAGLVFVNVALIQSRRRQPDVERLFRVPGVPWVPLLGVASNLALLASLEPTSLALAVGAATVGVLFWFGVIE
jgi:APA family basic amino acid/polyamine antiporter